MKREEIKKCLLCGKGVMHTGLPLFHRIKIERMAIDIEAVKRQHGLELMVGSPTIASVMGTDEDIAKPLDDGNVALICFDCSSSNNTCLAELEEIMSDNKESE